MSLISGTTQPIESVLIKGKVRDGLFRGAFVIDVKNKVTWPVETSLSCPLPSGFKCTHFTVKFKEQKRRAKVADSDDTRMDFDDTVAQGDFAAMAQVVEGSHLRLDLAALKPGEQCHVKIYFVTLCEPIPQGWLLVLSAGIANLGDKFRMGTTAPPLSLELHVADTSGIRSIVTPFSDSVIDVATGRIRCERLPLTRAFHMVVSVNARPPRCVTEGNFCAVTIPFIPMPITAPLNLTVFIEIGVEGNRLSVVAGALDFFVLSLPKGSTVRFQKFGTASGACTSIEEVGAFLRSTAASPASTFPEALAVTNPTNPTVIIASSRELLTGPAPEALTFLVDLSGELRGLWDVEYVAVHGNSGLSGVLVRILRMVAFDPVERTVRVNNEERPVRGRCGSFRTVLFAIDSPVNSVAIDRDPCPISGVDLPVVAHLWAIANPDEPGSAQILDDDRTVAIEREEQLEGTVSHVDARLGTMGVGWMDTEHARRDPAPGPASRVIPRTQAPGAPTSPASPQRPFFMLRLLRMQDQDGFWREEKKITNYIGVTIPKAPIGFPAHIFLTLCVIGALKRRAPDDEEAWGVIADRALLALGDWKDRLPDVEAMLD